MKKETSPAPTKEDFYQTGKIYQHIDDSYKAVYIGRKYKRQHTYRVIESSNGCGMEVDTQFTPNEPEKWFKILPTPALIEDNAEGFTKGEWKISNGKIVTWHEAGFHVNTVVCNLNTQIKESQANAALIASAPQLKKDNADILEVLEGFCHNTEASNNVDQFRNVYTKAKELINRLKAI